MFDSLGMSRCNDTRFVRYVALRGFHWPSGRVALALRFMSALSGVVSRSNPLDQDPKHGSTPMFLEEHGMPDPDPGAQTDPSKNEQEKSPGERAPVEHFPAGVSLQTFPVEGGEERPNRRSKSSRSLKESLTTIGVG